MRQSNENDQIAGILPTIRACIAADLPEMLQIINTAAVAYQGVIPVDRWHEPYMPLGELQAEIAAGVCFIGNVLNGELVGVMGVQTVRNVRLIRHAYVLPKWQGHGIGSKLIDHLRRSDDRPILIGTWAAASWAINFYKRHGFELVPQNVVAPLLRAYWNVPERQVETSVVLSFPALMTHEALRLIAAG
jgi:GNAT superfamily N-acetyltransferase